MNDKGIAFEIEAKTEYVGGDPRWECDLILKCSAGYFDPERSIENSEIMRERLTNKYWEIINRFLSKHRAVVRISGIHFSPFEFFKSHSHSTDRAENIICHYHHWRVAEVEVIDIEKFAIIECNTVTHLKKIFMKYWFPIGAEWHTEIFVLGDKSIADIEPWSRQSESEEKYNDLIDKCVFFIDNLHNGFHWRIVSNKENETSMINRINLEDLRKG